MRTVSHASRRRLVAAAAVCTLAFGTLAIPLAHANDDLKDEQNEVKSQIKSAGHDLDESSARLRRTTARLERAQAKYDGARADLVVARRKLAAARLLDQQMQDRLDVAEARLERAQADVRVGQLALDGQRVRVTDTITSIYEQGDPELLAFASLLDAETTDDLTRRLEARNVMVGRETRAYDELHVAEVLLQVRESEVDAARADVAEQREAAAERLVAMKGLETDAQKARDKVLSLVRDRRDAQQAANQARRRDLALVKQLKAREEQIRLEILRAAAAARGGYSGPSNGFLTRPSGGAITSPFGYRKHPIYKYWGLHDGVDIAAGCGEPLVASGAGTVISRYFSPVWGNRLYLSVGNVNGKNVTVIYNHLSSYSASSGEKVDRGEVVGYAGTTGWSTGCHLHFTVMVNGKPVDPMRWM